jgi:hypothetical protein
MKVKTAVLFVTLLGFSILLVSCFPTGLRPISSADFIEADTNTPSSIKQNLSENMHIDAEVSFDPSVKWRVVTADFKKFDESTCLSLFAKDKGIVERYEGVSGQTEAGRFVAYTFVDDTGLSIDSGSVYYSDSSSYQGDYHDVLFGTGDTMRNNLGDIYTQNELSDFSRQSAINKVDEIVRALDISVASTPVVYALDCDTLMKEWEDYEQKDGTQATPWTKEQEAYVVVYAPLIEGTPLLSHGYLNQETSISLSGSCVYGIVARNGLATFYATGVFVPVSSNGAKLVSLESAIREVSARYSSLIFDSPIEIYKASAVLVPVFDAAQLDRVVLKPMWEFSGSQTVNIESEDGSGVGSSFIKKYSIFVDGETGQLQRFE